MSRRRWLRSLTFAALLVTPLIAQTQGGWLLMFPPETPSGLPDIYKPGTLDVNQKIAAWAQAVNAQTEKDIRAPLSQWRQEKAYDSARECEAALQKLKDFQTRLIAIHGKSPDIKAPWDSEKFRTWSIDTRAYLARAKHWDQARCLPARMLRVY
jgi:hypothetical protein